jgi:hypothetical protein
MRLLAVQSKPNSRNQNIVSYEGRKNRFEIVLEDFAVLAVQPIPYEAAGCATLAVKSEITIVPL